jgi:hypothetical protein
VLGGIQIVATALIMACAIRYKDTLCPIHRPGRPTAKTAAGGTPADEPGSPRLPGRLVAESATSAGHRGALGGYAPALHQRSFAVAARPGPEPDAQAAGGWAKATGSRCGRDRRWQRFLAVIRAFSQRRGTGAGRRALRERCSSYLRPCTGIQTTPGGGPHECISGRCHRCP